MTNLWLRTVLAAAAVLALAACSDGGADDTSSSAKSRSTTQHTVGPTESANATASARPGHMVIVVMENHAYSDVIGNASAPYINSLARSGTSFTDLHAIRHPSQPNYIALFSGGTHGVTNDACPQRLSGPTLGSELRRAGLSFVGYSENLPAAGSAACFATGKYARKHAPWTNFPDLPASTNQPFTAFPSDYATLPTVSFVIPNLDNDMHDGSIARADAWTRQHLDAYATWARTHDSLLVVTWDEDDLGASNHIPTVVVGAGVAARQVGTRVTLYSLLRSVEDRYGLPRLGASASAPPLGLP